MDIDLKTAKYNELFAYAKGTLGLDLPHGITKPALLDLISKQTGKSIAAGTSDEANEPSARVTKELRELRKQQKVRIRIHESPDHPKRIPVSVNGVLYTIKPGAYVDVPESVVEVLRNAEKLTYSQREEDGKIITVEHKSLQFPFEVVGPAPMPKAA
jgi:hypothetical protein